MSSKIVTETEVINVPAVPFTETFRPVHHREVIAVMKESIHNIHNTGLEIVSSQYTLEK